MKFYLLHNTINLVNYSHNTIKTGSKSGKEYVKAVYCHKLNKCLFNLYAEYVMGNAGLDEAQAESRLPGEISITSDTQMTPPLWQKVKRNLKAS